ncbi:MAG: 1,6-anhydro-N-acetylmuramyl-L-alanine amidase AmpD [Gammaproteobacteria bacterium]|nr:1,6-anhydro-N-acetylmuramyl-L-alanine amidase AmpD [Gammaproteobacteria bacterium]
MTPPGRHWLGGVRREPSPNADERPADADVDLLVVHNISLPPGEFGGGHIRDLFLNRLDPAAHPYFAAIAELKVSAHLLVRRDGEVIQFVALDRRAWHAGQSSFCGRERCNDFSIGIELEGTDETPFTSAQYTALVDLTVRIRDIYPQIADDRIVGHADVAPGRKTDPGPAFDWRRYRRLLLATAARRPARRS